MKKNMIRTLSLVLAIAMVCCGCAQTQPASNSSVANDPGASSELMLSHAVLELTLDGPMGCLYPFHAEDSAALEWSVEDSAIVAVTGGRLSPLSVGTTVVTCTDGVQTASCTVIVRREKAADYALQIAANELSAEVGTTGEVEYTYTGPGAVTVFSSDPSVLRVENGRWVAVSAGTAHITCTDGMVHSQGKFTVTAANPAA